MPQRVVRTIHAMLSLDPALPSRLLDCSLQYVSSTVHTLLHLLEVDPHLPKSAAGRSVSRTAQSNSMCSPPSIPGNPSMFVSI